MKINFEILNENEAMASQSFAITDVDEEGLQLLETLIKAPIIIGAKNKEKIGEEVIVNPITYTLRFTKSGDKYFLKVN